MDEYTAARQGVGRVWHIWHRSTGSGTMRETALMTGRELIYVLLLRVRA